MYCSEKIRVPQQESMESSLTNGRPMPYHNYSHSPIIQWILRASNRWLKGRVLDSFACSNSMQQQLQNNNNLKCYVLFSSCKFLFHICCCCCCLGLSKSCPRINAGMLGSRQEQETQICRNRPSLGWIVPFPWSFEWWLIGCESNVSCFLKQVV